MVNLYQGDCLEEMGKVADHSVDMIFTDLPYGTTHNVWDKRIPYITSGSTWLVTKAGMERLYGPEKEGKE